MNIQSAAIGHVVVGYGYKYIQYYHEETNSIWKPVWYNPFRHIEVTEEVNFRNDTYLMISFGDKYLGYLNVNDISHVSNAYAVLIK